MSEPLTREARQQLAEGEFGHHASKVFQWIDTLVSEIEALDATLAQLKAEHATTTTDLSLLQDDYHQLLLDVAHLREEHAAVTRRAESAESDWQAAEARVTALAEALITEWPRVVRWHRVKCGACGFTYATCTCCQIGRRGTVITSAQCGGHSEIPCSDNCPIQRIEAALQAARQEPGK